MRCLTLANALRERGAEILFICREHDGHLCDLIEERGFKVARLPGLATGHPIDAPPPPAEWLASSWKEDAEQTLAAIEAVSKEPDWLVVDHYGIDQQWEGALRGSVGRIFVIDDLADRHHDCDLLLDQNLVEDLYDRYAGKVPPTCGMLLGPEYALLQPMYAELHDRVPPREGPVKRIVIYFGGADNENLTGLALSAFLRLNRPDIEVDVVITANSLHASNIEEQTAEHDNIQVHADLFTLAPLIVKADLAVGAAGATSWERLCLGLPSLVVTLADNQRPTAKELNQRNLVRWLGHHNEVNDSVISEALGQLIEDGIDEDWSRRSSEMVDGKGTKRVCAALTVTTNTPLHVRHARMLDEPMFLEWNSDSKTRPNTTSSNLMAATTHRATFRDCLRNTDGCRLYVAETTDGVVLGHVRFERQGRQWDVHCSLAPIFFGRGLGRPLLETALWTFRADTGGALTFGQITESDHPSQEELELSNLQTPPNADGERWRISVCSDERSWINAHIPQLLLDWLTEGRRVTWTHDATALEAGDICFYLGYEHLVGPEVLARHRNNLVVHESDLPKGRGWSPLTWQVLEGADVIPVTLFEAAQTVDSGVIYLQEWIKLDGDELVADLRRIQADATFRLCRSLVAHYPQSVNKTRPQTGEPTYYRRRRPSDGQLDPDQSLRDQFSLLRVSDNEHYPAWFEWSGSRYTLHIDKIAKPSDSLS